MSFPVYNCVFFFFMRAGTAMPRRDTSTSRPSTRPQPAVMAAGRRASAARRSAATRVPADTATGRRATATATRGGAARRGQAATAQPAASDESLHDMVGRMVREAVTSALSQQIPPLPPPPTTAAAPERTAAEPRRPAEDGPGLPGQTTDAAHAPPADIAIGQPSAQVAGNAAARATVHPAVASQIIGHQYINLGTLLDDPSRPSPSPPGGAGPAHSTEGRPQQATQHRLLPHFGAWSTAFLRYAAVYATAHPADTAGLLEHMTQVASLQTPGLGFAWREFDEGFRRARAINPAAHPWGSTTANSALWLTAIARGIASAQGGVTRSGASGGTALRSRVSGFQSTFRPATACIAYNRPTGCRRYPCPFRHECRICRGPHSMAACTHRQLPNLFPAKRRPGRQ